MAPSGHLKSHLEQYFLEDGNLGKMSVYLFFQKIFMCLNNTFFAQYKKKITFPSCALFKKKFFIDPFIELDEYTEEHLRTNPHYLSLFKFNMITSWHNRLIRHTCPRQCQLSVMSQTDTRAEIEQWSCCNCMQGHSNDSFCKRQLNGFLRSHHPGGQHTHAHARSCFKKKHQKNLICFLCSVSHRCSDVWMSSRI